jgi:fucose 4-O-acetylase-like acetyltransferase
MVVLIAVLLALAFGLAASFLMSRASNYSAAANIGFAALFVLALAGLIFLIVIVTERVTFG